MLDVSPENLCSEIGAARDAMRSTLHRFDDMVARYIGPGRSNGGLSCEHYDPEANSYEYVALTVGQLAFYNPRVRIRSKRGSGPYNEIAKALESAGNRWCREVDLRVHLRQAAMYMLFAHGAAIVTPRPDPFGVRIGDVSPVRPDVEILHPRRFIIDPLASCWAQARYVGHTRISDKEDLLARAKREKGWDRSALEAAVEASGDHSTYGRPEVTGVPTRREVVYHELWVPEIQTGDLGPDRGFNGTIYTVSSTESGGGVMLRKPRAAFCPAWGPYQMFGAYPAPGSVTPLSPLQACDEQVRELNRQALAMQANTRNYKRIVFYDAANPDLGAALANSPHDFAVPIRGWNSANPPVSIEVAGVTEQQLTAYRIMRDRVDRVMGMSDAQRGNVTGQGTATENAIADQSATVRTRFVKEQFMSATESMMRTVAWYMWHDDRFAMERDGGSADFFASRFEKSQQEELPEGLDPFSSEVRAFEDLDLEIVPHSMDLTGDVIYQRQMMQAFELVSRIAPLIPQTPHVDWKGMLVALGDALNTPQLAEWVNVKVAAAMSPFGAGGAAGGGQQNGKLVLSGDNVNASRTPRVDAGRAQQIGNENGKARSA